MQRNLTPVPVVAAALLGQDGQVLMQRRPEGAVHGGLWEFPGGKVEPGESPESALLRELREELGIAARAQGLRRIASAGEQPDPRGARAPIVIDLYILRAWTGQPQGLPGTRIGWFAPQSLQLASALVV